jgi:PAS domain S-box-containing protein
MPSAGYSFLDVVVLDGVRDRFAAAEPLVVLTSALDEVLWTNGPGAEALGFDDIESAIGSDGGIPQAARRQIMAAGGYPKVAGGSRVAIRFAAGVESRLVTVSVSALVMPDGEEAILLGLPGVGGTEADVAERAVSGFTVPGHLAIGLRSGGEIGFAPDDFARLDVPRRELAELAAEADRAPRRIVRRLIRSGRGRLPAGIARVTDQPARYFLLVIDESLDRPEAEATAPGRAALDNVAQAMAAAPPAEATTPAEARAILGLPASPADAPVSEPFSSIAPAQDDPIVSLADEPSDEAASLEAAAAPAPAPVIAQEATETPVQVSDDVTPPSSTASAETAADPAPAAAGTIETAAPEADTASSPLRFVWKTDADGRFKVVSPEFLDAVGMTAADLLGSSFREISTRFGLDPYDEISDLLQRRDTWSGRSVLWPVAGTDLRVPVDLAALPVYARDRSFEGFRGFGVARMADAVVDPDAVGLSLRPDAAPANAPTGPASEPAAPVVGDEHDDPFRGEVPALRIDEAPPEPAETVVSLVTHRPPARNLSGAEKSAFREIGDRLRAVDGATAAPQRDTKPADTASAASIEAAPAAAVPADARVVSDNAAGDPTPGTAEGNPGSEAPDNTRTSPASDALPPSSPTAESPSPAETGPSATTAAPDQPASAVRPSTAELKTDGFFPSAFAGPASAGRRPAQDTSVLSRLPVPILIHSGDLLHYANEEFLAITGYGSIEELADAGGMETLFADAYENEGAAGDRSLRMRTRAGAEFAIEALLRSVPWAGGRALMLVVRRTGDGDEAGPTPAAPLASTPAPEAPPLPASLPPAAPGPAVLPAASSADVEFMRARLAEMRTIIDTATDGVVLIDNKALIRSISRPAEALFGYESDELAGKPFASLFAMESQRAARDYLTGLVENGVASVLNDGREVIGREAQGRFIPLFMTIGRLPGDSGFCAVLRDITQWKRAEEDLTKARAVAERASSQKSDFLARISHEIRTPLNAIIGFSELMIGERFGPVANDRYRDYLHDINRSGNHVLELVNDLLDISKIEAGEQEMAHEAVSLNETLAQTVALMQPQANRDRIIIRSSFASRLPDIVADQRSIRQIALNLLSNAVRYTQPGGQVIVSTAYEPGGEVVMRVRDTGVGMTHAEIEQALKPFKQINALKRNRGDGTGLGLPLTKAMVEANRAQFAISSTPGEGTLVEVTFPSTRVLAD